MAPERRPLIAACREWGLYGVEAGGDLRWYRYDGSGQGSPDGSVGWASNSRNVIGNGWNNFKFLCGGGDGILFAVEPDGDLHFYEYVAGDGLEDPAGSRGWSANSGNKIGNGWSSFINLMCSPKAGPDSHNPTCLTPSRLAAICTGTTTRATGRRTGPVTPVGRRIQAM